ncbi:NUDIX hydrolase [Shewanella sp. 10N.286.51.B7]|uniref:NUDIX hydrolase n=1 Tax=Shewanella sp. 10N.286.51.B7 TaxID=1880836 RepID=UPI000C85532B|nr:NUDIX hydrolase [Shewanella sp. 10N.286.51.B7]PMG75620.1 NUDIX hydrolase [Shewanella sp. 10N.286.51.B7]
MTKERYKPNTTVACVIHCQNKFLFVEEIIDGETRFNQPAGHIEAQESIPEACKREVKEETGLDIELLGIIAVYQFSPNEQLSFVRFTFAAETKNLIICQPLDKDILACHWFTLDEIKARKHQLRSPLVIKSIEDFLHKAHSPLSLINSDLQIIADNNNA